MLPPSKHWTQNPASRSDSALEALKIINFDALCRITSKFYPGGSTCKVDPTKHAWGASNILFELCFDDDKFWVARVLLPDKSHPAKEKDYVLESEVATLRFLRENTTIPVPSVYGYDVSFSNEVGMPYMLMEAIPGKKLSGGGLSDFIPEVHTEKVHRQIADILLELYKHLFHAIGMLSYDEEPNHDNESKGGYRIGQIFDSCHRLDPYGPFETSLDFYMTRSELLNACQGGPAAIPDGVISHEDELKAIPCLVDPKYKFGPFYLSHPDFSVFNFLFDDAFNITALIDWSGCQTMPLESFANPPDLIIPRPDKFLEGKAQAGDLSPERRARWAERRKAFLRMLRMREAECNQDSLVSDMMSSDRSHLAMLLDLVGVQGVRAFLPRNEVMELGWSG